MGKPRPVKLTKGSGVGWRTFVQLATVVVGAVCVAVASLCYSSANGSWQQSVRDETRRSALTQESVRAVYGDEAPVAFRLAAARERAKALRGVRGTNPAFTANPAVAAELAIADQMAFSMGQTILPGTLAAGDEYARPDGGFDVHRRLANLVESNALDPNRTAAEGDEQARAGQLIAIAIAMLLATGVAVVTSVVPNRRRPQRRRSRKDRERKSGGEEPEFVPQLGAADRGRRRTTAVLLVLWTLGFPTPVRSAHHRR